MKKHIVQVLQSFQPGGLERMVWLLCRGLRQEGFALTVIATVDDGPMRADFEKLGASTLVLGKKEGFQPTLLFRMIEALANRSPTLMHTHHLGPYLYGALAAKGLRVPHVHTEHSHEFYDRGRRRWVGRQMGRFAKVACVSNEVAEHRRQVLHSDSTIVLNGVEKSSSTPEEVKGTRRLLRRRLGIAEDAFVAGVVCRLSFEKGVDRAVVALSQTPTTHLVVVGDGDQRDALQSLATSEGVSTRVHFVGWQESPRDWIQAMDVLVIPSRREGLPLAALEAMHEGVPFVGASVGELPRLAQRGAGWAVEGTASALALALERLRLDRGALRELAESARKIAQSAFGTDRMVNHYLELYSEVCS